MILIGVSSYFFFLLTLTPAATVISFLPIPTNTVKLNGIRGSIWSGSIDNIDFNNQVLQDLSWSLNPFSLLAAAISTQVQSSFNGNIINTSLDYSLISNQVSLSDTSSTIAATALQKQLNLPFGELAGTINLTFDEIEFIPGKLPVVSGLVNWSNAKLTLSDTVSFGNLSLALQSNDKGEITGQLNNNSGDLSIIGDIKITTNKQYTFNAKLTPRSNAPKELLSILSLIAPRKDKSAHIIQRNGRLSDLGITL